MDKCRSMKYDRNNSKENNEVVKIVAVPLTKTATSKTDENTVNGNVVKNPKKIRSALEISNSIGVHGAFGGTLSYLRKQGR